MDALDRQARITGWLYLLLVIPGPFVLIYLSSKLIVRGDATLPGGFSKKPLFIYVPHHNTSTGYFAKTRSQVRITIPSSIACAISMRSNGS